MNAARPFSFPPDRRDHGRSYPATLPELHPVRLGADAIEVDFALGGAAGAPPLDARVSARRVLAWLRSMPSYRAGVPLRLGGVAGAGAALDKGADLLALVGPGHAVTWVARGPLLPAEVALLARARPGVVAALEASPAHLDEALSTAASAASLAPGRVHWTLGPIDAGEVAAAERIVDALPTGSRISLRAGSVPGAALAALEERALSRRLEVSDFHCRHGLAAVGRGFAGVDRLTGQGDLARRALDLLTCAGCPTRPQCHGPIDPAVAERRLAAELEVLGLGLAAAPAWAATRTLQATVDGPAAPGDEAYLAHALGWPVRVVLSPVQALPGGRIPRDVLRRWWATGFLPVTELNATAERMLDDLGRREERRPSSPAMTPAPC